MSRDSTKMAERPDPRQKWHGFNPPEPTKEPMEDDWFTETVELDKGEKGGLGLSIAGGSDNPHVEGDPGIFVTKIIKDTPADKDGRVQLGDKVISVNGISLLSLPHMHAVQVLKDTGRYVSLVVSRKGGHMRTPVSTPSLDHSTMDRLYRVGRSLTPVHTTEVVLVKNQKGLGFSVAGGRGNQHVPGDDSIFLTKIIPGGPAEEEGTLSVGDRILKVDRHPMVDITHEEAVRILKATHDSVVLQVEKNAITHTGVPSSPSGGNVDVKPYVKRTVELSRPEGKGLGFNIIGGEGDAGIFISYISPSSISGQSEKLSVGDQILEAVPNNWHKQKTG